MKFIWVRMKSESVSRSVVSDSLWLCDCSLPGSFVHGILQARILEWVAIPFSRGSSRPRDPTQVSCIAGRFFTIWATREVPWIHNTYFHAYIYMYLCLSLSSKDCLALYMHTHVNKRNLSRKSIENIKPTEFGKRLDVSFGWFPSFWN